MGARMHSANLGGLASFNFTIVESALCALLAMKGKGHEPYEAQETYTPPLRGKKTAPKRA